MLDHIPKLQSSHRFLWDMGRNLCGQASRFQATPARLRLSLGRDIAFPMLEALAPVFHEGGRIGRPVG